MVVVTLSVSCMAGAVLGPAAGTRLLVPTSAGTGEEWSHRIGQLAFAPSSPNFNKAEEGVQATVSTAKQRLA